MRKLYPSIEPIEVDHLEMPGGHQIYVELCGKKDGIPVIFLHGGPGGGCKPDHRRFFDSDIYQIILFDQKIIFFYRIKQIFVQKKEMAEKN